MLPGTLKHAYYELVLYFLYMYTQERNPARSYNSFGLAFCGSSLLFSIIRKSAILINIATDGYKCSFLPHPHLYVKSKKKQTNVYNKTEKRLTGTENKPVVMGVEKGKEGEARQRYRIKGYKLLVQNI